MKFFDKAKLNLKMANILKPRNVILTQHLGEVHPFFSLVPIYLGSFYQGISQDSKTKQVLKIFSEMDTPTSEAVNQNLVFWFFWSMDRLQKYDLLNNTKVQSGLEIIWSIDLNKQKKLTQMFDELNHGEQALFLWKLIQELLNIKSLSPVYAFVHLRNAQMFVFSDKLMKTFNLE